MTTNRRAIGPEHGRRIVRPASLMRVDLPHIALPGFTSKTDMVAALIRQLIITGDLPAGGQLRQRDLAKRFGVSQTPVREALRRLESEGLVVSDAHRGFTVVEPDDGPVEENFQIRAALESLGASLAARKIDADGIEALRDLNEPDAGPRRRRPPVRGPEPGVPLRGVRARGQSPAAVADAAALGVAARRPAACRARTPSRPASTTRSSTR